MSALPQKRTCSSSKSMSAMCQKRTRGVPRTRKSSTSASESASGPRRSSTEDDVVLGCDCNARNPTGLDILAVCHAHRNIKDMDRLIFFRKPLVGLIFSCAGRKPSRCGLGDPTHSFDIAVSNGAIVGSWKLVELSGVAPRPVGLVELAHPKHGVDLRDDRHAAVIDGHARIIDKRERWSAARWCSTCCQRFRFFSNSCTRPPPGFLPLLAALALVAFAKRKQIVLAVAPHVSHCFKSFVAALEREVEGPLLEIFEFVVVLNDRGLVATARLFACFDQQIVPLLGGVVGDAFVAANPRAPFQTGRSYRWAAGRPKSGRSPCGRQRPRSNARPSPERRWPPSVGRLVARHQVANLAFADEIQSGYRDHAGRTLPAPYVSSATPRGNTGK